MMENSRVGGDFPRQKQVLRLEQRVRAKPTPKTRVCRVLFHEKLGALRLLIVMDIVNVNVGSGLTPQPPLQRRGGAVLSLICPQQ